MEALRLVFHLFLREFRLRICHDSTHRECPMRSYSSCFSLHCYFWYQQDAEDKMCCGLRRWQASQCCTSCRNHIANAELKIQCDQRDMITDKIEPGE